MPSRGNRFTVIQHFKGRTYLRLGSVITPLHSYILLISQEIFKAVIIFLSAYLDSCQLLGFALWKRLFNSIFWALRKTRLLKSV